MNTRKQGANGEKIAKKFLEKRDYRILEENFWTRYGEVDLIAQEGDYLVFVEVKSATTRSFASPLEKIDYKKRQHLIRVARYYLSLQQREVDFRFDVVAILSYQQEDKIKLIKNAFLC
ncbi:YraN family protein [Natroniella sulfidigena]|uniref:YraN family protein n=1 Tax=Natroniella sulfidigena TaxID=723921 RepID=UPI00200A266D|nr:YraN family protein [Natroniella sulfidigena]MCK8816549.1 YraN family protein [Natroniella sulfidigena]